MKKYIYIVVPIFLFVAIFLSSCGDGAVKDFATDFATKVSKNQVDSVRALYADAAGCDSFALNFMPDSMTIEEISDGMYKVSLGSADFTVSKADDGQMTVKESHGLFAYPAEKLDFAKSTGQYDPALSDAKNAERMGDEDFMNYINIKLREQSQNALVIVSKRGTNYGEGEGGIRVAGNYLFVVQNTTDNTIPGSAYQLIVTTKDWDIESLRDTYSSRRLPGKDLGPGEQATFACRAGTFGTSAKINYIGADPSTLLSNFKATGYEYAEYLSKTKPLCPNDNHPHIIDMGKAGKWACCNVGASKPEEAGDYFAWGETTPKSKYDWSNYKWGSSENELTKYCTDSHFGKNGFADKKYTLDVADDAAHANWGGNWRMPTKKEFKVFVANTIHRLVNNGTSMSGFIFTASNGNSIYIPIAGYRDGESLQAVDIRGYCWTKSFYRDIPRRAYCLDFGSNDAGVYGDTYYDYQRKTGRSVRAIWP